MASPEEQALIALVSGLERPQLERLAQQLEQAVARPPDATLTQSLAGAFQTEAPNRFDPTNPDDRALFSKRKVANLPFSLGQRAREFGRAVQALPQLPGRVKGTLLGSLGQTAKGLGEGNLGALTHDPLSQIAQGFAQETQSSLTDPQRAFEDPTAGPANVAALLSPGLRSTKAPRALQTTVGAIADPTRAALQLGKQGAQVAGKLAAATPSRALLSALSAAVGVNLGAAPELALSILAVPLSGSALTQFGRLAPRIGLVRELLTQQAVASGLAVDALNIGQVIERLAQQQPHVTGGGF